MADKAWEVKGHFIRNGSKQQFDNVYYGKNENAAKSAAMKDYNTYVHGKYEKKSSYGKLTITGVKEWTEADRKAFLKEKGFTD
ncbi:hypothetical protein SEA_LILMARTIN_119 [Streptomyces phage LilMartin]|nr:hypothetical protein SEA_LILMARTIN_119 [Streptomyces phage LilMartin]QNO12534.1 hypothetical protein SEA_MULCHMANSION_119 [Streptomyces phage MulchMansion]UVK61205.1 hypothetical protein SEA_ANGELA_120 [Streptomyces phage Angela]